MNWEDLPIDIQCEILRYLYIDAERKKTCHLRLVNHQFDSEIKQILTWYYDSIDDLIKYETMKKTKEFIILNTLDWIHLQTNKIKCTIWAMNYASKNNYLEVVKWLHENRTEGCTINALLFARSKCHSKIIEYLNKILS